MAKEERARASTRTAARYIAQIKNEILEEWEQKARNEIRAASDLPHFTLLDSLEVFLKELCHSLEVKYPKLVASKDVATSHAAQRISLSGFDLDQVLSEYNLLGQIIFQKLDDADVNVTPQERNVIIEFVQRGKQAAAVNYSRLAGERQAEISQALKQSEALHRQTFDYAAIGMAHVSLDGKWLRVNQRLCEIVGYSADELLNLTFQDITYPDDLDADLKLVSQLLLGQILNYQIEKRYFRKDRTIVWVSLTVSLIKDLAGRPNHFIAIIDDISRRKAIENALQESEARYRNLFANMAEEVHYWELIRDEEGQIKSWRLIDANGPALKTWGKDLAHIRNRTPDEIFGPGSTEHFFPIVLKIFSNRKPYSYENYFPKLDRYFRFTSFPVGERFFTTGSDITEIRRAEKGYREVFERFKQATAVTGVGVWEVDVATRRTWRTDSHDRAFGYPSYSPDRDLGVFFNQLIPAEDRERVRAEFEHALKTGEVFKVEFQVRWPDGSTHWLASEGRPLHDESGKIVKFLGTIREITSEVQAREILKESEENFRQIANALPQIIWTATPEFHVDWYNDWWYKYLGLARGTRWDDSDTQPMHPEDIEQTRLRLMESVRTGKDFVMEQRFRRGSDGQYRWHLVHGVPVRDDIGKIIRWIGANTDIHEQKLVMQKLLDANELRERFVATLSHDLRTPLAAARISAQLIQRKPDQTDRVPTLATRIADNIQRADRMIQDLLDSTRVQAGQALSINPIECEIVGLIRNVCEELSMIHGDRIHMTASAAEITGFWDCQELRRVIENLVSNGIKYGAEYSPVNVHVSRNGSGKVELSVHNWGNPIAPEEQSKLFSAFQRGVHATGVRGWGIGLTIVMGITEAHGGTVDVVSNKEQGTTFKVTLPIQS